jgi:hypothetical protein
MLLTRDRLAGALFPPILHRTAMHVCHACTAPTAPTVPGRDPGVQGRREQALGAMSPMCDTLTLEQRNYARCTCARSRAWACSPCCGCHSCRRSTTTNLPVRSCMRFSLLGFVELRRPLPLPFRPRALNLQVDSPVTSLLGRCLYGHIVALALALEHPTLIYASSPPHHFLPSFFCPSSLPCSPPQPSLIPLPALFEWIVDATTSHNPSSYQNPPRHPRRIVIHSFHSPVWPSTSLTLVSCTAFAPSPPYLSFHARTAPTITQPHSPRDAGPPGPQSFQHRVSSSLLLLIGIVIRTCRCYSCAVFAGILL